MHVLQVAVLDLRGTKVSQEGLSELARLSNLHKLCLGLCLPAIVVVPNANGQAEGEDVGNQQRDYVNVISS